eukprot:CAMPEP_0172928714 /NCGR_PEP_ID=MMETSP1075-20121228/218115_1 /TAXON_ID=2916 /ORGANISM="Ceratium fusus, Strain PA161109" /LENGTH=596 /DNA_ID=CAMNT_0013790001 /DNA_START=97 /DNA_END=1886 /DNA_ORIENTATION=-
MSKLTSAKPQMPRSARQGVVAFLKPELVAAGCYDGHLHIINVESGAITNSTELGSGAIYSVAWAPHGQHLAVGCSEHLCIVNAESGAIIRTWQAADWEERPQSYETGSRDGLYRFRTSGVCSVAYAPCEQHLAAGCIDGRLCVFNEESLAAIHTIDLQHGICGLAYAPDGHHLAAGCGRDLFIIETGSGDIIHTINLNAGSIDSIAYAPCGLHLAAGTSFLSIVNSETGAIMHQANDVDVRSVAYSPCGQFLATGGWKGIEIRNASEPNMDIHSVQLRHEKCVCVAYAPNRLFLVAGSTASKLYTFDAQLGAAIHVTKLPRHSRRLHCNGVSAVSFAACAPRAAGQHAGFIERNIGAAAIIAPPSEMIHEDIAFRHMASTVATDHSVLQLVKHDESDPPAIVDAQEAALFAAEQHAGFIERNIGAAPCGGTMSGNAGDETVKLVLLEYSRNEEWFRRALLESSELGEFRQALVNAGHCPELPSGAKCFVPPKLFEAVVQALTEKDVETHKRHVIVTGDIEHTVKAVVDQFRQSVSRRERGSFKLKSRAEIHVAMDTGIHQSSPSEYPDFVLIKRNFKHVQLPTSMRSASSVLPATV